MTKFQTILLAILAASVAGALYKFVPEAQGIAAGLGAVAIWLTGYAKQHPDDAKASEPTARPLGPPAAAAIVILGSLLLAGQARAESPQFGGCFSPTLCAGPSAAITVVSFNLADSTFSGGVSPGVGYGITWTPPAAPWAALGTDLYASFRLGYGLPNQGAFSLMGHFADYLLLGIGPTVTQRAGQSALVQWSILGGMGVPLGGTPKYVAERAR